ncbi:TPA: hypothetical protein ACSP84_002923 [Aeromonas veronii]
MNQHLVPGQGDAPLIKGIACLLSAERVTEQTSLLGKGGLTKFVGHHP